MGPVCFCSDPQISEKKLQKTQLLNKKKLKIDLGSFFPEIGDILINRVDLKQTRLSTGTRLPIQLYVTIGCC